MNNFLNRPWLIIGAGALLVGGFVAGQAIRNNGGTLAMQNPIRLNPAGLNTGVNLNNLKQLDETFAALAEAASQGVVFIMADNGKDSNSATFALQGTKSGSGFIYRSDGWIVTNDHVVSGYDKVKVVLADGREVTGKVVSCNDPQLDLALIKVDESNLPSLAMADSSQIRLGQIAMAIGAPFGLDDSVTFGHISAMGRPGQIPDPSTGKIRVYSGLIQTDAAINPGNSGGPLLNVNGDVIGVNSAINSQSGSSAGIGFAIPANVVKAVADEMISTGKFDRGLMGVNPRDLKPFEKKKLNIDGGAYSAQVDTSTPAYKAGIREKDVITAIDGTPVKGEIDLRIAMYKLSPGQTVKVDYVRDGKTNTTSLKLEAPPKEVVQRMPQNQENPFGNVPDGMFGNPEDNNNQQGDPSQPSVKPKLGVMVQQINETARTQFGLPSDASGVVITNITSGSLASKLNLNTGDVIQEINGKKISTVDDLTSAIAAISVGDQATIKFVRYKGNSKSSYTVSVPFR